MKNFVKLVPIVKRNEIYFPEIRIAKNTVLSIEYPINIISTGQNGLSHQGIGGHFSFWFGSGRKRYQILFKEDRFILFCLNLSMETLWYKKYDYIKLRKFINSANKDRTILYRNSKRKIKRRDVKIFKN